MLISVWYVAFRNSIDTPTRQESQLSQTDRALTVYTIRREHLY